MKIAGVQIGKKSVDDVLAVFTRAQEDLIAIADARHAETEQYHREMLELGEKVVIATDEANRATSIASRIRWVLDGGPGPIGGRPAEPKQAA